MFIVTQGLGSEVAIPAPDTNPPYIASCQSVDARTLDVIFSEVVVESEALVISNYIITPTLTVSAIQKLDSVSYRLTTSKQTELLPYTITAIGIHDLNGNLVI
jgi:hypothetical protein